MSETGANAGGCVATIVIHLPMGALDHACWLSANLSPARRVFGWLRLNCNMCNIIKQLRDTGDVCKTP